MPTSFSLDLLEPLQIKRRVAPEAAFADIHRTLQGIVEADPEMGRLVDDFSRRLRGPVLSPADAREFARLSEHGKVDLRLHSFPPAFSAGMSMLYLGAVETLRTAPRPITARALNAKLVRHASANAEELLLRIGGAAVSAMSLVHDDEGARDRLLDAGRTLEVYLDDFTNDANCEFCQITVYDTENGTILEQRCGTEAECRSMGLLILVIIVIFLLIELWDWLND